MKFRPCIDIHNGKVKQIVGGSLTDNGDQAEENFASEQAASYYAELYKKDSLTGGHIILLNPPTSAYYKETVRQAELALSAYPGGMQTWGRRYSRKCSEVPGHGSKSCDRYLLCAKRW